MHSEMRHCDADGRYARLSCLDQSNDDQTNVGLCCCNFRIHHYNMVRQDDGQVMIPDGRPFPGPVELIHHHSRYLDGFVTKPTVACQRPDGVAPLAWPGFTMLELEFELLEEAKKKGIKKVSAGQRMITISLFLQCV